MTHSVLVPRSSPSMCQAYIFFFFVNKNLSINTQSLLSSLLQSLTSKDRVSNKLFPSLKAAWKHQHRLMSQIGWNTGNSLLPVQRAWVFVIFDIQKMAGLCVRGVSVEVCVHVCYELLKQSCGLPLLERKRPPYGDLRTS